MGKTFSQRVVLAAIGLVSLALSSKADATASKKDILVASRALNFISPKPAGSVTAAIIFDGKNAASKADAESLAAIIGNGMKAGKVILSAKLVDVSDMSVLAGASIAFVAENTSAYHPSIAEAVSGTNTLVVSTDLTCVRAGKCALGVRTNPKVEIYVNRSAANDAGLSFLPAFLMMVKKV